MAKASAGYSGKGALKLVPALLISTCTFPSFASILRTQGAQYVTPPCEWGRRHAPVHERLHGRRPLGVCDHGRARARPGGGELRGKLTRVLAREDVDGRTVAHERSGHHRSEPAATARDDDHLAAHVEERADRDVGPQRVLVLVVSARSGGSFGAASALKSNFGGKDTDRFSSPRPPSTSPFNF